MLSKPPLPPLPSQVNKQAMQGKQNTPPANFNLSKSAKEEFLDEAVFIQRIVQYFPLNSI